MSMPPGTSNEYFTRWACGNQDAVNLLRCVSEIAHLADDIVDGDSDNRFADMGRLCFQTLVVAPSNPFFQQHHAALAPVLANISLTWEVTEEWRQSKNEKTRMFAFVMRECSEQFAVTIALLTGGYEHARNVIRELHEVCDASDPETFSDWENE
jgi:hypothetical protein